MSEQGRIAGIDIGTSKIRVILIDKVRGIPKFTVAAEYPSVGVMAGQVANPDKLVKALEGAVKAAETKSGSEITQVLLNISGPEVKSIVGKGSLLVSRFSHRVTEWDVVRVLEIVRQNPVPAGTEIVCAVPRSFFVDGQATLNPIGMKGQLLEVEAALVTAPVKATEELRELALRLGLNVQAINASIVADACALLGPSDKGVAVVDIGAGLTDVALFDHRGLCWMTSVPIGGEYITRDISFGLQVPMQQAEEIKLSSGSLKRKVGGFSIPGNGQNTGRKVNNSFLTDIIDSRLEEILQFIKKSIIESGFNERLHQGIVFTGGVAKTHGFLDKAAEYLNVPVRLGIPMANDDKVNDVRLSCGIGLIIGNAVDTAFDMELTAQNRGGPLQTLSKIFGGFFKKGVSQ